jgi:hypothetical protein
MLIGREINNMDVKSATILGQKFKVTTKLPKDTPPEMMEGVYGTCDRITHTIWINERLSLEHKMRTLFHEMGHAVMYRNGVAFSGSIPIELEEILVETFASMQYEFMRDYLKGMLKYEDNILRGKLLSLVRGKD